MKASLYGTYATRSLARGGQRTVFAVFCVAVGVLVIVALQLVGAMVNASLTGDIRGLNGGDLAVHAEGATLSSAQLAYVQGLTARGAITAYSAAVVDGATLAAATGPQHITFFAVNPTTYPLAGRPRLITPPTGSLAALVRGDRVAIADTLARRLGARVGDTLALTTDGGKSGRITVGAIIAVAGAMTSRAEMLMDVQGYAALSDFLARPVGYTWVWADVPGHSAAAAASVARRIGQQGWGVTTITVPQEEQQVRAQVEGIRTFLRVVGLLALLIGGIGIVNTMQVLLRRRRLEIAMLKTMGYRGRDLMTMFGLEAALLGLMGGLIGAAVGVGFSVLVAALVARAFFLTLPTLIDPGTVAAGVAIGVATTLIFGLLPIARTSAIRPLAALRDVPEPGGSRRALSSVGLVALLGVLFFLLALSILRNPLIAVAVVGGAGLVLALLTGAFAGLAGLLGRLPVSHDRRWWSLLPVIVLVVVAAVLTRVAPGIGVPLLALAAVAAALLVAPRAARTAAHLAVRNVGRARGRSATTLVALFVGVFAIGLGLALGQNLKAVLAQLDAVHNPYNAYVIAGGADAPAVARRLRGVTGLTRQQVTRATGARIVLVNGAAPASLAGAPLGAAVLGLDGVAVAHGQAPPPLTIAQGPHDGRVGRALGPADGGGMAALLPLAAAQDPLNLRLGDRVTVGGLDPSAAVTLRVVGFYTGGGTLGGFGAAFVDTGVVTRLSAGSAYAVYALHLDPATMDRTLRGIKRAIPGVVTLGDAAFMQQINSLLDNVVEVVEAVAALAMLAGLIMIANTVALAMLERRREIGLLKAIGHTSRGVLATVLVENAVLGVAGASCGLAVVALSATLLTRVAFASAATVDLAPALVLGLIAATALVCMLIAGGVAWGAARVRPLAVLRYE